tara:strand:- start:201 stop:452 length:252 start_codon:yes stop_codon:yes gene_type:complete
MNYFVEDKMKNKIIFLISFLFILNAQEYCAGETISVTHQNLAQEVCAGFEDYSSGDSFRLSDYNGDLNGGHYHVTFIDMSASW